MQVTQAQLVIEDGLHSMCIEIHNFKKYLALNFRFMAFKEIGDTWKLLGKFAYKNVVKYGFL